MAISILPIIKAVAPFVTQIATAAIPAFTAQKIATKSDDLLTKQIEELQAAATQNAQSIQVLAEKLGQAINNLENEAKSAQQQAVMYRILLFCSFGLSIIAISVSLFTIYR